MHAVIDALPWSSGHIRTKLRLLRPFAQDFMGSWLRLRRRRRHCRGDSLRVPGSLTRRCLPLPGFCRPSASRLHFSFCDGLPSHCHTSFGHECPFPVVVLRSSVLGQIGAVRRLYNPEWTLVQVPRRAVTLPDDGSSRGVQPRPTPQATPARSPQPHPETEGGASKFAPVNSPK